MRQMLMAIAVTLAVAGLSQAGFAVGEGYGGKGYAASAAGGAGRASSDGLTSTGFSIGVRPGGMGVGDAAVSSHVPGGSTDDAYQSTGVAIRGVGGKGRGTQTSASGKGYSIQVVRGVGTTSASPGGRGL